MKSKPIIRAIIFIFTIISIIVYPIGLALTSPGIVNKILDTVNFEKAFLDTYKNIVTTEMTAFGSEGTIEKDISNMFVKEENLRNQRIENVESFYDSISKKDVPSMRFELANPVAKVKDQIQNLPNKIKEVLVTEDLKEKCRDVDSLQCNFLKSLNLIDDNEENIIVEGEAKDLIDKLTIETSLGVNEDNINSVYNVYRVLKYGPEALLVFIVALMAIGYVFSLPNRKFARKLIYDFVKADLFALIFWGGLPYLFRAVSPIKLVSGQGFNLSHAINTGIADLFFEVSKRAVLVPLGLTALSIIIYVVVLMVSRMSKNLNDIAQSSGERNDDREVENSERLDSEDSSIGSDKRESSNREKEEQGTTVWSSKE